MNDDIFNFLQSLRLNFLLKKFWENSGEPVLLSLLFYIKIIKLPVLHHQFSN